MSVASIRKGCARQLADLDPKAEGYLKALEKHIYHYAGSPVTVGAIRQSYYKKYVQLLHNLRKNLAYLVANYKPSELILLDDDRLDPNIRDIKGDHQRQLVEYKNILTGVDEDEGDVNDGTGLCCSKCKGTRISVILRQLRSADEPMCAKCTCLKCGKKWKMN
jgi:DNA-directed RNA polymerase subunit M/transcription elongation factor TFIIS